MMHQLTSGSKADPMFLLKSWNIRGVAGDRRVRDYPGLQGLFWPTTPPTGKRDFCDKIFIWSGTKYIPAGLFFNRAEKKEGQVLDRAVV